VRSSVAAELIKLTLGSDVIYPSGAGPEYAFTFSNVRLINGPNLLTVTAETPAGSTSAAVTVTQGQEAPPPAAVPPQIALQAASPDVYIAGDAIAVSGLVTAQRCVQSVKVNGVAAHVTGSGAVVSFDASLSFAAVGLDDVVVQVVARDCDGQSATASYTAHHDDGAPVITVDGLALAPAVNSVTQTPYRLTGTVTDRSLAGLRANAQSLSALPASGTGAWSFAADVPLARQANTPITIEAWDNAGQHATLDVILRLDSAVALEIVSPTDGANYIVDGSSAAIAVTTRASGMAADDVVQASFDGQAPTVLTRAGDVANATLSAAATDGKHPLKVSVVSASGTVLASTSINVSFTAQSSIPLAVTAQEPANDATDTEANAPIVLHFNKPVDPTKLQVAVYETVHGKIYKAQPQGADILSQGDVSLVDTNLDREPVPGNAVNFPGNTMIAFYPSRDFGYAGQVQVEVSYNGSALYHSRFGIRRLPTLLQGFVANNLMIPLQGIEVSFPELGRSVTTDAEGSWSLGYAEAADKMLPDGRYRAVFNANMKDPRYGTAEGWVVASSGPPLYSGVRIIPLINSAEPAHFVQSAQSSPATFMQGDLTLDLSKAQLVFNDGFAQGTLQAQFAGATETGFQFMRSAAAPFGYLLNPGGVTVSGTITLQMRLPKKDGTFDYVDSLPARVALVGLDPNTLAVSVVGVARVDKQGMTLSSEGPLQLQRLDFIGASLVQADPILLERYGAGQLDLNQLIQSMESK
jgi:methionine-rich copper-binding protein CopC